MGSMFQNAPHFSYLTYSAECFLCCRAKFESDVDGRASESFSLNNKRLNLSVFMFSLSNLYALLSSLFYSFSCQKVLLWIYGMRKFIVCLPDPKNVARLLAMKINRVMHVVEHYTKHHVGLDSSKMMRCYPSIDSNWLPK
jgi:hypothetical protein